MIGLVSGVSYFYWKYKSNTLIMPSNCFCSQMLPQFVKARNHNIWEVSERLFLVRVHNNLLWQKAMLLENLQKNKILVTLVNLIVVFLNETISLIYWLINNRYIMHVQYTITVQVGCGWVSWWWNNNGKFF